MTWPSSFFRPAQPAVSGPADGVTYAELPPDLRLSGHVHCYWQLRTERALAEPFCYRVVADGCMDVFFAAARPTESFVMGFATACTVFPLGNSFHYTGIRFLPGAFPVLFGLPAADFTDRCEPLTGVLPQTARFLAEEIPPGMSLETAKPLLDAFVLRCLSDTTLRFDPRLLNALNLILQTQGTARVETDLDAGVSARQLRRVFAFYIGDTPKTFSRVVRFQHLLNQRSVGSLRQEKVFYDAGYYDQAHFIKEFKTFYGLTPTVAWP
jgi:AraC-like DNA-binding protein